MKPFSDIHEVVRKPILAYLWSGFRGLMTMASVLSAIYRQFLNAALSGVASQEARR
jgi:hypothetical protein